MNSWMPAITAPEDEPVLIWAVNAANVDGEYMLGYKDVAGNEYWWVSQGGQSIERHGWRVTHWRSLPVPPGDPVNDYDIDRDDWEHG